MIANEKPEIFFIDAAVTDTDSLTRELSQRGEVVRLTAQSDGLLQIADALAAYSGLAAVHIISHGSAGSLQLGSAILTHDNLSNHSLQLADIGNALAADGDILLYGCNVAAGANGTQFIEQIASLTGADVAASNDLTGSPILGGDWQLEKLTGRIESQQLALDYAGTLITSVSSSTFVYPGKSMGEYKNFYAFAAIKDDGSVITWGDPRTGSDSSAVANLLDGSVNVTQLFSTGYAFAALRADGSVVTWGNASEGDNGGDSSAVSDLLNGTVDVIQVFSTVTAFAALRADGSVVTWGNNYGGGNSSSVTDQIDGTVAVTKIFSTVDSFAALRVDGSVITWGYSQGNDSSSVADQLNGSVDVIKVFSTDSAFAALRTDGSVITWGNAGFGGDSSSVATQLNGIVDVKQINSTIDAFAALRADGSVITWGYADFGGDSSSVANLLNGTVDITQIYSTESAFAALRADGSVITWGNSQFGGDSSSVASQLDGTVDVMQIYSNGGAFAALRADGSVVTWGYEFYGGNSAVYHEYQTGKVENAVFDHSVSNLLDGTIDVTQVYATDCAFAALRSDGSLVTWGDPFYGGSGAVYRFDPAVYKYVVDHSVFDQFNGTASVTQVYSGRAAFTALFDDGSVVSWGWPSAGGDCPAIASTNVLTFADIYSNEVARYGTNGNDMIKGDTGVDIMIGGNGSDGYYVNNSGDRVVERNANEAIGGTDTVYSYLNAYTLATSVEIGQILAIGAANLMGNILDNTLYGGAGNNVLNGGVGADTMIGGNGNDTYFVDDIGDVVTESDLGDTDTVSSYLSTYILGTNVENGRILATGTANLTGNTQNNVLYAGTGNNALNGSSGTDTVSYQYAIKAVTANLAVTTRQATGGSGSDTFISIENISGSNYNDIISGNAGANFLNGSIGADRMIGGDGNDTYYVENTGDVVTESNATASTGGIDLVYSYLSTYTLTANVENGRIMSTGTANLIGNSLNNLIYAGAGNNVLNGGSGTDTVIYAYGLSGTTGVAVTLELATAQVTGGSGADALIGIENLVGSNYNDKLTGNGGGNSLSGGLGNDSLNGGAGADKMTGGDGSDTYYVDNVGDVVTETNVNTASGGTDTVYSNLAAYLLVANVENGRIVTGVTASLTGNGLDNLLYAGAGNNVLNGGAGTDTVSYLYASKAVNVNLAVAKAQATLGSGSDTLVSIENITGSNYNDILAGNTGANVLNGGAGADRMVGGNGNDSYYVDNIGDLVSETSAGGGIDTVYSYLTAYTLTANVEIGRILAAGAANLSGNGLNNTLYGSDGSNGLNGGLGADTLFGGNGNDILTGGAGADRLVFNTTLNATTNVDTVNGFQHLEDVLQLDDAIFSALAPGHLSANVFVSGSGAIAGDANDRILYDSGSGALYYDADGNGAGAAVQFATLTGMPALTVADFYVI